MCLLVLCDKLFFKLWLCVDVLSARIFFFQTLFETKCLFLFFMTVLFGVYLVKLFLRMGIGKTTHRGDVTACI